MNDLLSSLQDADPRLASIFAETEIEPLQLTDDVYGSLIESIIFQQLSVKAANSIYERFLNLFPNRYPEPSLVLGLDLASLRAAGLSKQKAGYIQNTAGHFEAYDLLHINWSTWSDEDILKELTKIKGVGTWTVQMMLMFTLGRPDILPVADLAIQQAMQKLYRLDGQGKQLTRQMLEVAEVWSPHRSLVARYLWRWRRKTMI